MTLVAFISRMPQCSVFPQQGSEFIIVLPPPLFQESKKPQQRCAAAFETGNVGSASGTDADP